MRRTRVSGTCGLLFVAGLANGPLRGDEVDAEQVSAAERYVLTAEDVSKQEQSQAFFAALELLAQRSGFDAMDLRRFSVADLVDQASLDSPFFGDQRFIDHTLGMIERYEPFVWGGIDAQEDQFPESVVTFGASDEVCSGVLVAADRVLTAGHCVCERRVQWVRLGQTLSSYTDEFEVKKTLMMGGSCAASLEGQDLALLTLEGEASADPARLADFAALGSLESGTVVGFGRADRGRPADIKRYADIVIASPSCNGTTSLEGRAVADAERYGCVPDRDLVAGSPAWPADACGGDSGGPFYTSSGSDRRLLAITSRGIPRAEYPCGDGGVYTRLDGAAGVWLAQQGVGE